MKRRNERGLALVVVLWSVTLLVVIAISIAGESRSYLQEVAAYSNRAVAKAHAEGAIYRAIAVMSSAVYANSRFDESIDNVSVSAEAGKLNLNLASETALLQFIEGRLVSGNPDRVAARLLDWRDRDDAERENGAESAQYVGAGAGFKPRNGPFLHLDEMHQVLGLDRQTIERLQSGLTVHSRRRRPSQTGDDAFAEAANHEPLSPTRRLSGTYRRGRIYSVTASSAAGTAEAHVNAKVLITGHAKVPYRIIAWESN